MVSAPAAASSLTVPAVDRALTEVAATTGPGSAARRDALVGALLSAATPEEQQFLVRLRTGELRQGALEGVVLDAVASAAGVPAAAVRRAFMLSGRLSGTAVTALTGGVDGRDLLDEPLHVRLDTLAHLLAADEHAPLRMPGVRGPSPEQASGVLDDALAAGHQGVVVKALDAPYAAGRRGRAGRRSSPCTPSTSS